jgi:outer membrane receptor protein involved in Fe transport
MLKKLFVLFLLLSVFSALAFAGITGKITGKVKDKESGEPVVGASVVLQGTTLGAAVDVTGDYFIINIPPGTYTLRVSAIGYQSVTTVNIKVSSDATATVDVIMSSSAVQVQEVVVQAERPLVEKSVTSTIRKASAEEIVAIPRENVQGIIALTAGVVDGANMRGGRATDNAYLVDGLTTTDPQIGGQTGIGVSMLAVEEVQVLTGGFSAEYGNMLSGVVNTVTKEGSIEKYEGTFRSKFDMPTLNGKSDKGYKLAGINQSLYEFSFGGPLPTGWKARFFLSGKYDYQQYANATYAFIDPAGNNIGQKAHDRYVARNVNAKVTANPMDNLKVVVSGFTGVELSETSSWTWLYGDIAQQPNTIRTSTQAFVRGTHTLSNATFYELTLSYFNQKRWDGKKDESIYFNPMLDMFELYDFEDKTSINDFTVLQQSDGIMDRYAPAGQGGYGINPTTGHREGPAFTQGNQNPYGTVGAAGNVLSFVIFGNSRTFTRRSSDYTSLTGTITSQVNKFNLVKAGFDIKLHKVFRQYNSLPWDANPFADKYEYEPRQASLYLQDKVEYQGIILNPGIRFDYLDPNAKKIADVLNPGNPPVTTVSKAKMQVSPRFGISFPVTERSKFFLNYGWYFQEPVLTRLYESITRFDLSRGNQIFGNPDLEPQKTKAFEIGYGHQLTDMLALDVTAYYKDLYNIEGVTFVPAVPSSFTLYSTSEYGNVRGVEFAMNKRLDNYWRAKASYAYSVGYQWSAGSLYRDDQSVPPDRLLSRF